ncbi:MAG: TonB-dependent receptor [Candidatus Marinimicrobia bacterium]|nr:TonB-dependent receptor [Candidatus Neomarinimicrobiota bacterium]MCF7828024.1 TonB-dependent receptor [Candidatus Neomarinimicrobiota bacterium]MCF7879221.1 TonB-dependent receptor [Candidatus Neomarinimicrobiota bacterium]
MSSTVKLTFYIAGILWLIGVDIDAATLSGFVKDAETTDPLTYANVVLRGTERGATTDQRGYFIIHQVPAGEYTLSVSYIGYAAEDTTIQVQDGQNIRVDFSLMPQNIQGEEVVVTANRRRFEQMVETSTINLTPRELEIVPAFVEADIFRSIQMLPGVVSQNDFSAALVVRGGSPDENLILLDGIEVYNPYHFGGIFSAFNTDAIRDADFKAGGFPVRYGGRLSSVLEISTKEGNPRGGMLGKNWPLKQYWDITGMSFDVSLLSSKAFIEGPIYKGGYTFSARRTYFDKVADMFHSLNDTIPTLPYYFYDLQWRAHSQITPSHRIDVQGYHGADNLTLEFGTEGVQSQELDFNWIWGNTTNSIGLKSILRPDLVAETMIARSVYDFDVDFSQTTTDSAGNEVRNRFIIRNALYDLTFSEKIDWKLSEQHRLQLGLEYKRFAFEFSFTNNDVTYLDEDREPRLFSLYAQDSWKVNVLLNLQFGVRTSFYSLSDRPWTDLRGGFKYRVQENTALKGSIGSYSQFLFTSNDDDAVLRIVDFWLPVPEYLDPQRAIHYVLGIEQWIGEGHQLSLEGYYKPYLNALDANPIQSVYDETDDYIAGTGTAYGIETIFKRSVGDLSGWIAYTWSSIEKRIDLDGDGTVEPEHGEVYHPKYDKRHNFNLVVNYRLNERNAFGLSWNWSSGQPYTPVVGKMYGGNETAGWFRPYLYQTNISGNRNSANFPAYVRGDISYTRQLDWFGWDGEFKFQILNFTNQFNVLLYQWDHSSSPSTVVANSMFPIIPTFGFSFRI